MARAAANKVYRNFTAGLITEASPLTYPENASIDEDNCVITRKGNRRRRLGIDYIENFVNSTFTVNKAEAESTSFQEFEWNNVDNEEDRSFLVLQVGRYLRFFDVSNGLGYPEEKSFSIDLNTFRVPGSPVSVAQSHVSMAAGRGFLFVVGPYTEPFYVEYSETGDTVTASRLSILVRDTVGVDDGLSVIEEPSTLSAPHQYNLLNQGWTDPSAASTGQTYKLYDPFGAQRSVTRGNVIAAYNTSKSRYPSNSQVWWVGKNSTGAFDPDELVKQYFGGTRAPRGFFIIDAMTQNRSEVSGLTGIPSDSSRTRPRDVAFWAGRTWWAHQNDVYFSQVLEDVRQAGNCYQEADPTSEQISDLIDSDGGQVPIPEAIDIQRLIPYGNGLLVFADNGVWHLRGTDVGFTARDYSVDKVSSIGIQGRDSVVVAGQNIFWWSRLGIQGIQQQSGMFGPVGGSFETTNISEPTIQGFINSEVASSGQKYVKGHFDPSSNTVQWLFKNDTVTAGDFFYNRILNLDLGLNAFYPWTLGVGSDDGPWLCGVFSSEEINDTRRNRLSRYISLIPDGSNYRVAFAIFKNRNFSDWQTYEGEDGYNYESRLLTGFELMDDSMRDKELSHLQVYFNKTETTYIDEGDGDYSVDRPSSCKMRVRWDWADSSTSGNWSREVETYRHGRLPPVNPSDLAFDSGSAVVSTKHRVRGHGRAIQFEFRSNKIGYDFDLLGWAANITGNTNP